MSFAALGLHTWLVKQCGEMGLKKPSEIQENCIPQILKGNDCIGCAKTGSGKTAAFALPILQRLSEDPYGIFALVLTPTRELAIQIGEQFRAFGKGIGLKDSVVIGGMDMVKQGNELFNKPHVVIATPGRLAALLMNVGTVSFKKIQFLVLDEADRLLESSFEEDLQVIFDNVPEKRQTLLFSATLNDTMTELVSLAKNEPYCYEVKADSATVSELDQRYILIPPQVKDCYLVSILQNSSENKSVIIFTQTCRSCQVIANLLRRLELRCAALHSMMPQRDRISSLAKFRIGYVRFLVATDVASRGLDIPQVELVINYNVPACPKDYIHRVGRTARAGRGGMSLTIMTQHDIERFKSIEDYVNVKMTEFETNEKDTLKLLKVVSVVKREVELRLNDAGFGEKRILNRQKRGLPTDRLSNSKSKRSKEKRT